MLDQHEADNISMDINYTDKVVLRRFTVKGLQYYLMIVCPQAVDERSDDELSLRANHFDNGLTGEKMIFIVDDEPFSLRNLTERILCCGRICVMAFDNAATGCLKAPWKKSK